jgi:hypothetical protein
MPRTRAGAARCHADRRHAPAPMASPTATDTRANSKLALSRSLR